MRAVSEPHSETELDALIDELRATIAGSDSLSPDDRERLGALLRRIETHAPADSVDGAGGSDDEDDENIFEQLDDALSRFEAEHVGLVSTINRIANLLSASGI
jgi:hypothetical protein